MMRKGCLIGTVKLIGLPPHANYEGNMPKKKEVKKIFNGTETVDFLTVGKFYLENVDRFHVIS